MGWMAMLHEMYHWTEEELMHTGLSYILDLYVVKDKLAHGRRLTPIDQSGFF